MTSSSRGLFRSIRPSKRVRGQSCSPSSSTRPRRSQAFTRRPSSTPATGWSRRFSVARARANPDVGIWVSRYVKGAWTAPVEVATGVQPDGKRHPCWNPVLVRDAGSFAGALLQGWTGSTELVGHAPDVEGRRAYVERRAAASRRHPRPDQEQASPAGRRHYRQPEQHRVERRAQPVARPFRALERRRQNVVDRPSVRSTQARRSCKPFSRASLYIPAASWRLSAARAPRASSRHGLRMPAGRGRRCGSLRSPTRAPAQTPQRLAMAVS